MTAVFCWYRVSGHTIGMQRTECTPQQLPQADLLKKAGRSTANSGARFPKWGQGRTTGNLRCAAIRMLDLLDLAVSGCNNSIQPRLIRAEERNPISWRRLIHNGLAVDRGTSVQT
jgi:hypothetical protein